MTCEKICKDLIKLAVKNFDYFRANPRHLAWVMMHYELSHRIGRIYFDDCLDNPKYPVIDAGEKLKKDGDSDLLYDAWGVTVSNDLKFPDIVPGTPESNPRKTLDDWKNIMLDLNYKYHKLYSDARGVEDHLLCAIGTGMDWTKGGYIDHTGPSDVPETNFYGYTKATNEIPIKIRKSVVDPFKDPKISKAKRKIMRIININAGDNHAEQDFVNRRYIVERRVEGYVKENKSFNLLQLKRKALKAFRYVCYFEQIFERAESWSKVDWEKNWGKKYLSYKGFKIKVSEINIDFMTSSYSFADRIEKINSDCDMREDTYILRKRESMWSHFVYYMPRNIKFKHSQLKLEFKVAKKHIAQYSNAMLKKPEERLVRGERHYSSEKRYKYACAVLDRYRPNFKKYKHIYDEACKGDLRSIKIMDRIAKVPNPGWDALKYLVHYSKNLIRKMRSMKKKLGIKKEEKPKKRTYYPICEYSCLVTMPENAHKSYVIAAKHIAKSIVNNPDERKDSQKYAKKFLKKWQK